MKQTTGREGSNAKLTISSIIASFMIGFGVRGLLSNYPGLILTILFVGLILMLIDLMRIFDEL